jgi:prophage antirepressor-like protein
VIDDNGAIWFVGKDVAIALGYARPNDAINEHCKGTPIYRPLQKLTALLTHQPKQKTDGGQWMLSIASLKKTTL